MKQVPQKNQWHKVEGLHPHFTLLYLAIVGSSLMFLFLGFSFVFSLIKSSAPVIFPKFFALSTIVILFGSYVAQQLPANFVKDDATRMNLNLLLLSLCGILFLVSQLLGWRELVSSGIVLRGNTTGALLYILSGLHLLHLLGGLIYNAVVLAQVKHMRADPIKSLLIFSSQYEHLKIKMLVTYWHFIDAIWVVLFIVFLFTI